jgi:hypothetical protein
LAIAGLAIASCFYHDDYISGQRLASTCQHNKTQTSHMMTPSQVDMNGHTEGRRDLNMLVRQKGYMGGLDVGGCGGIHNSQNASVKLRQK